MAPSWGYVYSLQPTDDLIFYLLSYLFLSFFLSFSLGHPLKTRLTTFQERTLLFLGFPFLFLFLLFSCSVSFFPIIKVRGGTLRQYRLLHHLCNRVLRQQQQVIQHSLLLLYLILFYTSPAAAVFCYKMSLSSSNRIMVQ